MFESLLPSLISAGANIFGGVMSAGGAAQGQQNTMAMNQMQMQLQRETNAQQLSMFHESQDWQEQMSNTAYQRQMADMKQAGLNPILAYQKGGGASTPSPTPPQLGTAQLDKSFQNDKAEMGRAIGMAANSAVTAYKDTEAANLAKEQQRLVKEQAEKTRIDGLTSTHDNEKRSWEAINERKRSTILDADTSAAQSNAKLKEREAADAVHWGVSPGALGQAGASAEHVARRVLEQMNNYGGTP